MPKIPNPLFMTADEIEQLVRDRVADADASPGRARRQAIVKEIVQLACMPKRQRIFCRYHVQQRARDCQKFPQSLCFRLLPKINLHV